jgi:hypothetical protein
LSYCGIKPLPERFGLDAQDTSSIASLEYDQGVNQVPIFEEETMPFFGHLDGNFQPSGDAFEFDPVATGGQVSNQKVAVTSINNKDGVGNGKDFYTL